MNKIQSTVFVVRVAQRVSDAFGRIIGAEQPASEADVLRHDLERKTALLLGAQEQCERMRRNWLAEKALREKLIEEIGSMLAERNEIVDRFTKLGAIRGTLVDRLIHVLRKSGGAREILSALIDRSKVAPGFYVEKRNSTPSAPWVITASDLRDYASKEEATAATWNPIATIVKET